MCPQCVRGHIQLPTWFTVHVAAQQRNSPEFLPNTQHIQCIPIQAHCDGRLHRLTAHCSLSQCQCGNGVLWLGHHHILICESYYGLLWVVLGRRGFCIIHNHTTAHHMFNNLPCPPLAPLVQKLDFSIPLDSKQIRMIQQVPVKARFFQLGEVSKAAQ